VRKAPWLRGRIGVRVALRRVAGRGAIPPADAHTRYSAGPLLREAGPL